MTETTTVTAAKTPSKKSLAQVIFDNCMAKRAANGYTSNKEFRTDVVQTISTELSVTIASASTMYNSAKKDAETAAEKSGTTVGLGRDPKKVKAVGEPKKRGRTPGSKNKEKVATTEPTVVVVDTTETATAETVTA